jgi:hypothetical protein
MIYLPHFIEICLCCKRAPAQKVDANKCTLSVDLEQHDVDVMHAGSTAIVST